GWVDGEADLVADDHRRVLAVVQRGEELLECRWMVEVCRDPGTECVEEDRAVDPSELVGELTVVCVTRGVTVRSRVLARAVVAGRRVADLDRAPVSRASVAMDGDALIEGAGSIGSGRCEIGDGLTIGETGDDRLGFDRFSRSGSAEHEHDGAGHGVPPIVGDRWCGTVPSHTVS